MPHVMPKWYRDRPDAKDEKTRENRDDHADLERREFIREAAMRLRCVYKPGLGLAFSPGEAWATARNMWDCKPEDC